MHYDIFSLIYLAIGFVFGASVFFIQNASLKKEIKSIKRQYEKKSVGADDSALKVKTLENKIKTLETALKKQMEKSE